MILQALRGWRALTSRLVGRGRRRADNRPRSYRPCLEALEDRWLLSTITVLNNLDSGAGSLRNAITNVAVSGDTIDLTGLSGTILLNSEIAFSKNLTITGPGAATLSISGQNASRIFDISSANVALSGLTLTQGQDGTASGGGAVLTDNSNLTFDQVIFTNNKETASNGGAIEVNGSGTLNITDSTFASNANSGSGAGFGHGGAIDVADTSSAAVTITGSTFNGNSALFGGAISLAAGSLSATNSTFTGNTSEADGGAICTVLSGPTVTLFNDTIADNTAGGNGGGISLAGLPAASLGNSIVAANQNGGPSNFGPDISGHINSQDYNLFTSTKDIFFSGTTTHNQTVADPMLGPLGDDGGPTQTISLLSGSPALGAGAIEDGETLDQRGQSRPVGAVDIGAFQTQAALVVTTAADPGGILGQVSLREAINLANAGAAASASIAFAPALDGQTITLTAGELGISNSVTIDGPGVTVSGNHASGVFVISAGTVTLSGLTITGGQAPVNGGGVAVGQGSTVTIQDSTIANNSAGFSGGGLRNDGGTVMILDSTISGNSAPFSAGISNNNGLLTLINTTVSGNSATDTTGMFVTAGGLANYTSVADAPVTLINDTFSGNTASDAASANDLASVQQGGGAPTISLVNTILAGSAGSALPNAVTAGGGTIVSLGHNLSSDGSGNLTAAGDLPNTDPLLGPLANNGGPTLTQALLPGSPAIDAGDNNFAPATDQRGVSRPQGAATDIGAFESLGFPTISGPATVVAGQPYTLTLSSPPQGDFVITAWTIRWGDGTIDTLLGNPTTATHVYANAASPPNGFQITATATTAKFGVVPANPPLLVTVLTPAVAVAKAAVVNPGDSTTLNIPGPTGLTATLTNAAQNQNLTLFVALYRTNPTGVPMDAAAFFDVRVSSTLNGQPTPFIPAGTTLIVTFAFPPTTANPTLLFFDSSTGTYKPVKSSPPPPGVQLPSPAPGEITVVFDSKSFPAITDLGGTVLAIPVQNPAATPGTVTSDAGPSLAGTVFSPTVTINTSLTPAVAIALGREGNGVNDAGSSLSSSVTFKSSNNLSLNLTASQDSVAAPVASAVGNEAALTPEQAAQFAAAFGDLKDKFAQAGGMVFRLVSDLAAMLADQPPSRVPVAPAEQMKPDNPEDEEAAPDISSGSATITPTRSASEEIPFLALWASMEARSASEGTEARSASEGTIEARSASEGSPSLALRASIAPAEESKLAALPAWLWAGLALGWIPTSDRGARSWRRRGLRNEEAIR